MYKITQINNIKCYNMSAGKTLPQFLEEAKKTHRSLRYNEDFKKRIQLIQDFQFEVATNQVEISRDQRYIVATGIYAPQVKIFDTTELSLKCLRGIDSQVVKFRLLSDDYSKIVMAQQDRSIDFHAQYGAHYKTRIPHYPRDLQYNPMNANLCISASAPQIYRISLEQGKFLTPFHTSSIINSLSYNPQLNILACGGEAGVQIWDFRERNNICSLDISGTEVTYVKCDGSGLLLGVGTKGQVDVYDFRFDRKLYRIKSAYNEPINGIHFTQDIHKSVLISNRKQIKITQNQGTTFYTSIQPTSSINMFTPIKGTGMILAALQDPKIGCYFLPQLGSAPRWVPYIENITEELEEEQKKVVYDEYRFVTKQEVYELGCGNLIGTKMLKEYMHGYLIHQRLYNKYREKLDLVNFAQARQRKIQKQLQNQLPVRIETKQKQDGIDLDDNRFQQMKQNPQFAIDRHSESYILRHPHMKKQLMRERAQEEDRLEKELRIKKKKFIGKDRGDDCNNNGNSNGNRGKGDRQRGGDRKGGNKGRDRGGKGGREGRARNPDNDRGQDRRRMHNVYRKNRYGDRQDNN